MAHGGREIPSAPAAQPDSVTLFGIRISNLDFDGVCARLDEIIAARKPGFIVTPNVDHICKCYRLPGFRELYGRAVLAFPDGVPIMWASRLLRSPLRNKLSGSDMVPRLCAFAAEKGHSVFFFGGSPGTAAHSAERLKAEYPSLRIAGVCCPEFGFENKPEMVRAAIAEVRAADPDICFVALGTPKQEFFMDRHHEEMNTILMGVGGTFDFISGRIRRAPAWMQRGGLEWFWRLLLEPRRLWRRYLWEDLVFLKILVGELFSARRAAPPQTN